MLQLQGKTLLSPVAVFCIYATHFVCGTLSKVSRLTSMGAFPRTSTRYSTERHAVDAAPAVWEQRGWFGLILQKSNYVNPWSWPAKRCKLMLQRESSFLRKYRPQHAPQTIQYTCKQTHTHTLGDGKRLFYH